MTELIDIAEQPVTSVFAGLDVNFVKATVIQWNWEDKVSFGYFFIYLFLEYNTLLSIVKFIKKTTCVNLQFRQ